MPLYALAAESQLSLGRYEESLEQHKRILYVNSRTKDSGHSRQLKSQARLASTYLLIGGKVKMAIPILENLVEKSKEPDETFLLGLATAYSEDKQYEKQF